MGVGGEDVDRILWGLEEKILMEYYGGWRTGC
jgi:hypothetical protein